MDKEFKADDVVQLRSGGPKMTVAEVVSIGEGLVRTSWFAGSKLEHGNFSPQALAHFTEALKSK